MTGHPATSATARALPTTKAARSTADGVMSPASNSAAVRSTVAIPRSLARTRACSTSDRCRVVSVGLPVAAAASRTSPSSSVTRRTGDGGGATDRTAFADEACAFSLRIRLRQKSQWLLSSDHAGVTVGLTSLIAPLLFGD